jgi:hypothetical protein
MCQWKEEGGRSFMAEIPPPMRSNVCGADPHQRLGPGDLSVLRHLGLSTDQDPGAANWLTSPYSDVSCLAPAGLWALGTQVPHCQSRGTSTQELHPHRVIMKINTFSMKPRRVPHTR